MVYFSALLFFFFSFLVIWCGGLRRMLDRGKGCLHFDQITKITFAKNIVPQKFPLSESKLAFDLRASKKKKKLTFDRVCALETKLMQI